MCACVHVCDVHISIEVEPSIYCPYRSVAFLHAISVALRLSMHASGLLVMAHNKHTVDFITNAYIHDRSWSKQNFG